MEFVEESFYRNDDNDKEFVRGKANKEKKEKKAESDDNAC